MWNRKQIDKKYNVALIVSYLSAYAHNKKFSQCDSKERTEKWNLINGTIFVDVKGSNNLRYRLTILFINTYILVVFQVLYKCTRYMQKNNNQKMTKKTSPCIFLEYSKFINSVNRLRTTYQYNNARSKDF